MGLILTKVDGKVELEKFLVGIFYFDDQLELSFNDED